MINKNVQEIRIIKFIKTSLLRPIKKVFYQRRIYSKRKEFNHITA